MGRDRWLLLGAASLTACSANAPATFGTCSQPSIASTASTLNPFAIQSQWNDEALAGMVVKARQWSAVIAEDERREDESGYCRQGCVLLLGQGSTTPLLPTEKDFTPGAVSLSQRGTAPEVARQIRMAVSSFGWQSNPTTSTSFIVGPVPIDPRYDGERVVSLLIRVESDTVKTGCSIANIGWLAQQRAKHDKYWRPMFAPTEPEPVRQIQDSLRNPCP